MRRLDLHGCKCVLRGDALAAVGAMAALRALNLSACAGCSDAVLAPLSRLSALSELNLASTDVTEARVAHPPVAIELHSRLRHTIKPSEGII